MMAELYASLLSVVGTALLALNLPRWSRWGWVFYFVANLIWVQWGFDRGYGFFVMMQAVFAVMSVLGIYRWWFK
jgi:hypothetical protein